MTHRNLTCAAVDELLGDYLEGELDVSAVAAIELHLAGCAGCRALVRDFTALARSAAALPVMAPSHDLWPVIAQRIEAPVADLAVHARTRRNVATASSWRRWRTGALAAGLVGITAFAAYQLTDGTVPPVQGAGAESPSVDVASGAPAASAAPHSADAPPVSLTTDGSAPGTMTSGTPVSPVLVSETPPVPARETFSSEISVLRGLVAQRRDDLDPRTIAILETSISTIDSAIAEARRALEADPGSRFLSSQLNKSLEKKLGLLRTAALLPPRT